MTGKHLPHSDSVVRYINKTNLTADGMAATETAFLLRPGETGISVNWLDYYKGQDKDAQLAEVRKTLQLEARASARFGELGVGEAIAFMITQGIEVSFQHFPIRDEAGNTVDPSHSEIRHPSSASMGDTLSVSRLLSKCVKQLHPAKL